MSSNDRKISLDQTLYTTADNHVIYRGPRLIKEDLRKASVDATEVPSTENLSSTPQRRFSITGMLFGNRGPRAERQTSVSSDTSDTGTSPDDRKFSVMESPEFRHFVHRQSKMLDDFST